MRQALVTGSSRGIGRAIALELVGAGHKVIINYKERREQAEVLAEEIRANGGSCDILGFDVSHAEQASEIVSSYIRQNGPIDIVVNNAGVVRDQLFPAMKLEAWNQVIQTTLMGFFAVTKPCIMGMLRQSWGRIVNIASVAALLPSPGQSNYSAAKAGLIGATRSLSAELCHRGILVNAVAPGLIDTEMLASIPVRKDELLKLIPMKRFGTPEEVARLVGFLVSDQASYITGQVISINGGMF